MKTLLIIIGIVIVGAGLYIFYSIAQNFSGTMSPDLIAPNTIKTGEPTDIDLIISGTGGDATINTHITKLLLYYRLVGEDTYTIIQSQASSLPDNYKAVQSKIFLSNAYKFTIPPYPKGTSGEMQYYILMTIDNNTPTKIDLNKNIEVSDDDTPSFNLKNNLSVINICNKNFRIDAVTLEGIKVTQKIAQLIDQESSSSLSTDKTTICHSLDQLPERSVLNSKIENYDPKNLRYIVYLQFPFIIDLKANLVYKFNETNNSLGKVFGNLQ